MKQSLIFWPVLVQLCIPLVVLLLNAKRKAADVKTGAVDLKEAAMNNEAWSKPVVLTSKNLSNQFQFPVVFYVACVVLHAIDGVTAVSLGVAWLFVVSRCVHVYVHVTSNYVPLRMRSFIVGVLALMVLLVLIGVALVNAA